MQKLLTFFTLILFVSIAQAQPKAQMVNPDNSGTAIIQFDNVNHDFGTIKEDDGDVSHIYKFKNVGNVDLKLTNVHPGCGCTVAEYTREAVAPGGEGFVKATFSVAHKEGRMEKAIMVTVNGNDKDIKLLSFTANVIKHTMTLVDSFPIEIGNVRLESNAMSFDKLANNVKDTVKYLGIYNSSNSPIIIKDIRANSKCVSSKDLPFTLLPHKKAKFPIHYNAIMQDNYGVNFDQIKLLTTDQEKPEKGVTVFADVHQYIPKMTDEEKANAGRLFLQANEFDFGTVTQGEKLTKEFKVKNSGKNTLEVYRLKSSNGFVSADIGKSKLKAGESTTIKVVYNTEGVAGTSPRTITVISNDPVNPEQTIIIKSNISALNKQK